MVAPVPYGLTGLRRTPGINPGAGLQYRPMNPWRSAAAGGLQGLGGLLMALGSGQPQQAMPAFQAGLQGQQDMEERRRQQARDEEVFGLQKSKYQLELDEAQAERDKLAEQNRLIDSLGIPEDQKTLLRTGLAKYSDLNPKDSWEIKTIREGDQDVTYRINPMTGVKEKLGSGMAFKPGRDGTSLSISSPVWGVDKQGNPVLLQMSPTGVAVQTQLPEGVTPVRPATSVDVGTGTAMVSPITGEAQTVIPKDVEGKAAAEEIGTATGKVTAGLPDAIAKAEEATALIDRLKNHPGRAYATGKSSYLPIFRGTDAADFNIQLNQLKGTVFLQAYAQLKGGGAITQIEGEKAEQAIARLDTAQSEAEFVKSLEELQGIINNGVERMKARAAGGGTPYATPNTPTVPKRVKVNAQGEVIN
jgi:hypothetical protein